MRIGLPRALLYYYYQPLWQEFFQQLGHQVIVSPMTNQQIINAGVRVSVPEICVPIKIMNGHLQYLLQADVDFIFVPRMVSIQPGQFFCPKFMGLPNMVSCSIPEVADKLLTCDISAQNDDISNPSLYYAVGRRLGNSEREVKRAAQVAGQMWRQFRSSCLDGVDSETAASCAMQNTRPPAMQQTPTDVHLSLLGYVYNVHDNFLSMELIKKLNAMGVKVSTFEMLPERTLAENLQHLDKSMFWTFSDKLLGAGYAFYRDGSIDGLIHLTAFGCGPDSMLGKVLELESGNFNKPFMTLRIDEHTGESHLLTRLEAFVDMIRLKKRRTNMPAAVSDN